MEGIGPQHHPYREERRRGLAWSCIGTANLLRNVSESNFQQFIEAEDYNGFSPKEIRAIESAHRKLKWVAKALYLVAINIDPSMRKHTPYAKRNR